MKILTGSKIFTNKGNDIDYIVFSDQLLEREKGVDKFRVPTNINNIKDKDGFYIIMTYIFYQELGLTYTPNEPDYFKNYYDANIDRLEEILDKAKSLYIQPNTSFRRWWFEGAENYLKTGTTNITKAYVESIVEEKRVAKELITHSPERLRAKRELECFPIINRGKLWYDSLNPEQLAELNNWYNQWLEVTTTKVIPTTPQWIK